MPEGAAERRRQRRYRPSGCCADSSARRRVVAALLVIVSFRYSIGVFEPLWATYLDDLGASTIVITLSLTGFALPMLIIAKRAGRLSDRFGPRVTSVRRRRRDGADHGVVRLRELGAGDHAAWRCPTGSWRRSSRPARRPPWPTPRPHEDAAAAQGLGEAAGSAAAAIGALTAAPLFSWLGSGPTWLIAGLVMGSLLTHERAPRPPGAQAAPAGGRAERASWPS